MLFKLIVLISGNGSNLQAIIDAIENKQIPAEICLVLSDQSDAYGLVRAQQAKIRTATLKQDEFLNRKHYQTALLKLLQSYQPDLIVLAGFMRIIDDSLVDAFGDRLINIHPSLLPKHRGLNTHQRVIEAQDSEHGCSIHFVNQQLDSGPIIAQAKLNVNAEDDAISLQSRVQKLEHQLYPLIISAFAEQRLQLKGNSVTLDGKTIPETGILYDL